MSADFIIIENENFSAMFDNLRLRRFIAKS